MNIWKLLMKILARADFENHREPRFNNNAYSNEYGNLYANTEAQSHYTEVCDDYL